jgi:hypothetical protein
VPLLMGGCPPSTPTPTPTPGPVGTNTLIPTQTRPALAALPELTNQCSPNTTKGANTNPTDIPNLVLGKALHASVEGSQGQLRPQLFITQGTQVFANSGNTGLTSNTATLDFTPTVGGAYQVRVRECSTTALPFSYDITVTQDQ